MEVGFVQAVKIIIFKEGRNAIDVTNLNLKMTWTVSQNIWWGRASKSKAPNTQVQANNQTQVKEQLI